MNGLPEYRIEDDYFKLSSENNGVSMTLECQFVEALTKVNLEQYFDTIRDSVNALLEVVGSEV